MRIRCKTVAVVLQFGALVSIAAAGCASMRAVNEVEMLKGRGFRVYQRQVVAVWLSCSFQEGLTRPSGDGNRAEVEECEADLREVGELFWRGLIDGEDFLRELGMEIPDQAPRIVRLSPKPGPAEPGALLDAYDGPLVKILNVVPEGGADDGKRRTFDLWVTLDKFEDGWGSFDHFRLNVLNPRATPETSGAAFARGATSAELRYEGTEI